MRILRGGRTKYFINEIKECGCPSGRRNLSRLTADSKYITIFNLMMIEVDIFNPFTWNFVQDMAVFYMDAGAGSFASLVWRRRGLLFRAFGKSSYIREFSFARVIWPGIPSLPSLWGRRRDGEKGEFLS